MKDEYILSIDCGTQSIRAIIFDKHGSLLAKKKVEFEPYFSEHPGWAEQHVSVYWDSLCTVCRGVSSEYPELWHNIKGVVLTTMRDTCVNIEKDGNVLRPAIVWLDQREAKGPGGISFIHDAAFQMINMREAAQITMRKSKAYWIKENQPEIWDRTYKFLLISGYLSYRLTGRIADSTASQIGHIPFDYKYRSWPKSKSSYRWKLLGVEQDKLPELVEPGGVIGTVSESASLDTGIEKGMPVIACGSDKGCETLGTGCLTPDCASISFGTTATVQTTTKDYIEPIPFMPAYPAVVPGRYNPEVEIMRGYWMISWFKKEFSYREMAEADARGVTPETVLNETLCKVPPGSQGLILQPYWGPGLKMPEAKGAIIGFDDVHTRAHIYRAIIEGINYALLEGIEKIEGKSKTKIKKITVSGGGSQSDAICQITADMLNRPVYRAHTYETSALGAAITGFVSMGVYPSFEDAVQNMVNYQDTFHPDEVNAETYKKLYRCIYKKIYPSLRGLYKELRAISIK